MTENVTKKEVLEGISLTKDAAKRLIQIKKGKKVFNTLSMSGVICDWREPEVIRFAPHPLFNTYTEIFDFVKKLEIANG